MYFIPVMAALYLAEWVGLALITLAIAVAIGQVQNWSPVLESTRYIVRFKEYRQQEYLEKYIVHRLYMTPCDGKVRWVARNNLANKFPTDFGVLESVDEAVDERYILVRCLWMRNWGVMCCSWGIMHTQDGCLSCHGDECLVKDVHLDRALLREPRGAVVTGEIMLESGEVVPHLSTQSGRMQTKSSFALGGTGEAGGGRSLLGGSTELVDRLKPHVVWEKGFSGTGIKMGVFDTGIKENHPDVEHVDERSNWTHEPTLADGLGHGSFVAGVIAGKNPKCPGLAPNVSIYTFRVFTNDQVSFTSWFLDAFNYAMATDMDVLNLSIGGPDFMDAPFVDKVMEVTSSGIIMTSAIGNDGPTYGTMNNPADQNDVIGVGGITYQGELAGFSSRGMTTWEIPLGYGRAKPDIMTYGSNVQGASIKGGCRGLSGTSVSSPVVAGAVCLLASTIPKDKRSTILNPASMKQVLIEGANRLPHANMFEQGQGALSIEGSYKVLRDYAPRISIVPAELDLTDCPYTWPFCSQPIYADAMPLMFNATILNGMGVDGRVVEGPQWAPTNEAAKMLDVRFEYSDQLWPWSGYVAVFVRVLPEAANFSGKAEGMVTLTVESPSPGGKILRSSASIKLKVDIIPTPSRSKRILWDQFHSIKYPPAYIPRDDLNAQNDILDWHADHPHTNFHTFYDTLRREGYFLEILNSPFTCFNASNYGALMIVDSEEEFYPEEIDKVTADVTERGLGLLIAADWYDLETIHKMRFYDDNTRSWWEAVTGGANIPALNDLLQGLEAAFAGGSHQLKVFAPDDTSFTMYHGSSVAAMPNNSYILFSEESMKGKQGKMAPRQVPVLGLATRGAGRFALYGDSNCLDSANRKSSCEEFALSLIKYLVDNDKSMVKAMTHQPDGFGSMENLPLRPLHAKYSEVSFVLQNPIKCYSNSPLEYQNLEYQRVKVAVLEPPPPSEEPSLLSSMSPQNGKDPQDEGAIAVAQNPLNLGNRSPSFEDRLRVDENWYWKASKERARITGFAAIMAMLLLLYTLRRHRKKRKSKR